jgi:hypothetical protein
VGASLVLLAALLQVVNPIDDVPLAELTEWGRCAGEQALRIDRPSLTPDQVADAAFEACAAHERLVEAAQLRINARRPDSAGPEAVRREVRATRERNRAGIASAIGERRGLPPTLDTVSTRAERYGRCLAENAEPMIAGSDSGEAIADAAFAACAAFERRVMALAPPAPPDQLEAAANSIRTALRATLLRNIAAARAGR